MSRAVKRSTKKRIAFEQLPKAEQRVCIAKDVLKWIAKPNILVEEGQDTS